MLLWLCQVTSIDSEQANEIALRHKGCGTYNQGSTPYPFPRERVGSWGETSAERLLSLYSSNSKPSTPTLSPHTLPSHSPLTLSPSLSPRPHSIPVISSFFSVVRRMSGLDRALASRVKSSSTDATILSLSSEVMEGRVTRRLGAGGVATSLA